MNMEQRIARINELAHKAKTGELTEAEKQEREILRKEYVAAVRANLTAQLENTYVLYPDGSKRKLTKSGE